MTQLKSQILGLSLALMTAIGCIAYEKLVKNYSLGIILMLASFFYVPALIGIYYYDRTTITNDLNRILSDKMSMFYCLLYFLTWSIVPLWYIITRKQGIMTGSIYEVKYILILALFYIVFGENKLTLNTCIGIILALCSIYFISK